MVRMRVGYCIEKMAHFREIFLATVKGGKVFSEGRAHKTWL